MRLNALWFALLYPVFAQQYVRVNSTSDGRSYTIDLAATAVQRALRPVSEITVAAKLPQWLYPAAGSKPSRPKWDPVSGVVTGSFLVAGTQEQLSSVYQNAFRGQGLKVSSIPSAGGTGVQITGYSASVTVGVQIQSQAGSTSAFVSYAPRNASPQHFDVVWYDDTKGILLVRDSAGAEYQLDKSNIVSNNLNKPGAVASEGASIPSWLPVYPAATASPKGQISWMFKPTAEFVTNDPIRQVYEFYLSQLRASGVMVKSSGLDRSGTPLRDFSAHVVAIKGDEQVEVRISEVTYFGAPVRGSGKRTGIGIRYTVPKR